MCQSNICLRCCRSPSSQIFPSAVHLYLRIPYVSWSSNPCPSSCRPHSGVQRRDWKSSGYVRSLTRLLSMLKPFHIALALTWLENVTIEVLDRVLHFLFLLNGLLHSVHNFCRACAFPSGVQNLRLSDLFFSSSRLFGR